MTDKNIKISDFKKSISSTLKAKIFFTLCYFVFSLQYIYLISIWESIIPSQATTGRQLGETLYLDHIGYSLTMIAFYLLPLLFF